MTNKAKNAKDAEIAESAEKADEVGVMMTLQDMIDAEAEFDVELWDDLARKKIDDLDEEDRQTVEEAVATILWYMGLATCTVASEPCEADYRRLRECCGQAWRYRNVIRETFMRARGMPTEEWRPEHQPDEDAVLH